MFKCNICNREFVSTRSLGIHIRHHDEVYHEKAKVGAALSAKARQDTISKKKIISIAEYNENPKRCATCNVIISYCKRYNKFCSHSCSATTNNKKRGDRSKSTKEKISVALKEYTTRIRLLNNASTILPDCTICGKSVTRKTNKTCSEECKGILLSKIQKERVAAGKHHGNSLRNRKKRSFLEKSFKSWIDLTFPGLEYKEEYTTKIFKNGKFVKCYYIDFFFPSLNLGIELDGSQHLLQVEYDRQRDIDIFENYGIQIERISYKEYMSKTKIEQIIDMLSNG